MPSFNAINYSLRPSKSIQRQVVFEGVRRLQNDLEYEGLIYVGFGSVWFTDFMLAHKVLGIDEMVSIEADPIGFQRALFNAPFSTVVVREGMSSVVLPELLSDDNYRAKPWLIWLDYDYELNEGVRDDIRLVIEHAPANSLLLATFNGLETKYGAAPDRPDRLKEILGAVLPDNLPKADFKKDRLQSLLADRTLDFMQSVAADLARPGGFVPAFRFLYQDGAPMVTVGGLLPKKGAAAIAKDIVQSETWQCMPSEPVKAPHLTNKEAAVLQALLPRDSALTRADVQALGFDLHEEELRAFQSHYREYPSFAQIVT